MRAARLVRMVVLPSLATEDTTQMTLSPLARWAASTRTLMLRTVSANREYGASRTYSSIIPGLVSRANKGIGLRLACTVGMIPQ